MANIERIRDLSRNESALLAIGRLRRLLAVSPVVDTSWTQEEERRNRQGPYGNWVITRVNVRRDLGERQKQRLIDTAIYSTWKDLSEMGFQFAADRILKRSLPSKSRK